MNKNLFEINSIKSSSLAEKIFYNLDKRLEPSVYSLALDIGQQGPSVFIEPSKNDEYANIIKNNIDAHLSKMDLYGKGFKDDILFEFEMIELIKTSFDKNNNNRKNILFFSNHFSNASTLIIIVIKLDKATYDSHYRLKDIAAIPEIVHSSFLDAVIARFLKEASRMFKDILEGKESILEDNELENNILKLAGNSFMMTAAQSARDRSVYDDNLMFPKISKFYDNVTLVSSILYEGREARGRIILFPPGSKDINAEFVLKKKVQLSDSRSVRKLLEMCDEGTSLLYRSGEIFALGSFSERYNPSRNPFFEIHFKKHYSWSLYHGCSEMMNSVYGMPLLSDKPFDSEDLKKRFLKSFPTLSGFEMKKIINLIVKATSQKHGTIIVISKNAEEESDRLKNQAVLFEPFQMTEDNLMKFSNIDGAIIMDVNRMCHGVGVILDGKASINGNPSRGSRYNSAIRYIESQNNNALAVVISEDGMVDLI